MPIVIERDDQYHANAAVGRSTLWTLHSKTPAHAMFSERKESPAMAKGTLLHLALLQPEILADRVVITDDMNKNTNVWKAAVLEAEADGKIIVQQKDILPIQRAVDSVTKSATLRSFLDGCVIEQSLYWHDEEHGIDMKARPDATNEKLGLILDVKTTRSAGARDFQRSVAGFGYHVQDSIYRTGAVENGLNVDGFFFLALEMEAPYAFALYELDEDAKQQGWNTYRTALASYAHCQKTKSFPAYSPDVQSLTLPSWAFDTVTTTED